MLLLFTGPLQLDRATLTMHGILFGMIGSQKDYTAPGTVHCKGGTRTGTWQHENSHITVTTACLHGQATYTLVEVREQTKLQQEDRHAVPMLKARVFRTSEVLYIHKLRYPWLPVL